MLIMNRPKKFCLSLKIGTHRFLMCSPPMVRTWSFRYAKWRRAQMSAKVIQCSKQKGLIRLPEDFSTPRFQGEKVSWFIFSNILYTLTNTKRMVSILTLKKLIGNSIILQLMDNCVRAVAENLYEHQGKLTTAGI